MDHFLFNWAYQPVRHPRLLDVVESFDPDDLMLPGALVQQILKESVVAKTMGPGQARPVSTTLGSCITREGTRLRDVELGLLHGILRPI